MINPYPSTLRPRSNSNPTPSSYHDVAKHNMDRKQPDALEVPQSKIQELELPPRPPRNPARLFARPHSTAMLSDQSSSRDSKSDWEWLVSPSSSAPYFSSKSQSKKNSPSTSPQPQFSTLDRTILRELKQSMLSRSSQFQLKNNNKHHPFRPDEVPYPRSYDKLCVDCDVWETIFCKQFSGSVTWHVFSEPPAKVLDLGCGTGSWILDCAQKWKNSHFVGLDVVPLHPDLGGSQIGSRVTWVQANFLDPLPFPNEEFDFVHIKRIARGVPEDKWDLLFEEITRVMKSGGAFEMIEEDLYLPGRIRDCRSNSPSSSSSTWDSASDLSTPLTSIPSAASSPRTKGSQLSPTMPTVARVPSDKALMHPNWQTSPGPSDPQSKRPLSPEPSNLQVPSGFRFQNLMSKLPSNTLTSTSPTSQKFDPLPPGPSAAQVSYTDADLSLSLILPPKKPAAGFRGRGSPRPFVTKPKQSGKSKLSITTEAGSGTSRFTLKRSKRAKGKEREVVSDSEQERRSYSSQSRTSTTVHGPGRNPGDTQKQLLPSAQGASGSRTLHTSGARRSNSIGSLDETKKDALLSALEFNPSSYSVTTVKNAPIHSSSRNLSQQQHIEFLIPPTRATHTQSRMSPSTEISRPRTQGSMATSQPQATYPLVINPRDHRLLEIIYTEMHASRFINLEPLCLLENYLGLYFKDVRTHAPLIFTFPPPRHSSSPLSPLDAVSILSNKEEVEAIDLERMHDAMYDHDRESILSAHFNGDLGRFPTSSFDTFSFSPFNVPLSVPEDISRPIEDDTQSIDDLIIEFPSLFRQPSVQRKSSQDRPSAIHVPRSNFVSQKDLFSGSNEYVSVDKSKMPALSPRHPMSTALRRPFRVTNNQPFPDIMELPSSHTTNVDDYPYVSPKDSKDLNALFRMRTLQRLNMLPNQTADMDLRTLKLHLNARVAEVLACAESMWDWIVEFQRNAKKKELEKLNWRNVPPGGATKRSENVKHANLRVGQSNREDGFGTRSRAGSVVSHNGGTGDSLSAETKSELSEMTRERFDEILAWFQFDMTDMIALGGAIHDQFDWPFFIPQRTDERMAFDLACTRWELHENQPEYRSKSRHGRVPPSMKLCRTMRVFVAWKA